MSYREELEQCFKSGQMSAAQHAAHVLAGEIPRAKGLLTDSEIDTAIYEIDAVMNAMPEADPMLAPFMPEHMDKMRAIIRALYARAPL